MAEERVLDEEITRIFKRLRDEVVASARAQAHDPSPGALVAAREELERLWPVTADRPFLRVSGTRGRLRAAVLAPPKAVLRRLLRWYVEPALAEQREFNAALLRLVDAMIERVDRLERGD